MKKTPAECGRMGGSVKSARKAKAVRENGRKGGRPRESASWKAGRPFRTLLFTRNGFNPKQLTYLSVLRPADPLLSAWLSQLRRKLGMDGMIALGIPQRLSLNDGPVRLTSEARLVFYLWSALFCPSNLASAFHMATWGRFNADMPQDYRAAALRLIDRKGGPSRARLEGRPYAPFRKPWQGKVARRMIYAVPPTLPLL